MSSLPITYTVDETMNMLRARAESDPERAEMFFLKVYRRPSQYGRGSEHIATFSGAGLVHFAQPEAWLPGLFGGGDYEIHGYDPADPSKKIGGMFALAYPGAPKKSEYVAMKNNGWRGPRGLIFPEGADSPQVSAPAVARPLMHVMPDGTQVAAPVTPVDPAAAAWREREQVARENQALQLKLATMEADQRADKEQAKLREERAHDRAEAARQMQELKAQIATASATKPAGPSTIETIVAVATAMAPIAKMFFDNSEKNRELESARAREASAAQTSVLAKLAEPKGMSPEVTMLLEMMKSQSSASGEMMGRMVEVMSAINGMSVSMIETMAANLGGDQGNPILEGVKDIVKAVASANKGAETGVRRQVQQMVQPPALPQQAQYAPPPASATATGPQSFAGMQDATQAPRGYNPTYPVVPNSTTAAIEGMIRNHEDPDKVITFLISKIDAKDADLLGALSKHGGDVEQLIADRLGAWAIVQENNHYLDGLAASWQRKGTERGFFEPDEEAPVENDATSPDLG